MIRNKVDLTRRAMLRGVEWRDLTVMRPADGAIECLHPLPWLLGSWGLAAQSLWLPAIACSFMFFLTALRLNHEAIHGNLGFRPHGHRAVLHALSALMLGSNNAVAFNHLQHHAHLGTADDLEGKCGDMTGWKVLAYGPLFPVEMHIAAWRRGGPALRQRMRSDLALNGLVLIAAFATDWTVLAYHLAAMTVAQCLTAYFAVWITHRGCAEHEMVARTQRAPIVNLLTYNMFLHLEHHLVPGVPVKRLGILARRIDSAAPDFPARAPRVLGLRAPATIRRAIHL
jgi:fatty acid desaturase